MTETPENIYRIQGVINFAGYNVPKHTQEALERYIVHKYPPGDFLIAVLCNDLLSATSRADSVNARYLYDICKWVITEAPGGCWGSEENVRNWLGYK